jgi:hypothetical protein
MSTYRLVLKRKGKPDEVRTGLDELNATIIPAELKLAFPKQFETGAFSVEITKEK